MTSAFLLLRSSFAVAFLAGLSSLDRLGFVLRLRGRLGRFLKNSANRLDDKWTKLRLGKRSKERMRGDRAG